MAQWMTPTDEQRKAFEAWRASRPKLIQDLIDKLGPWTLYMLRETRHRCTIHSWNEDGTVTVAITGQYNLIPFGRRVFGVPPEDLTECDLPAPGELVGTTFNEKQTLDFINEKRAENGISPLTMEQLDQLRDSEEPACAIDTETPEVSDGKSQGQEEGEVPEQGKEFFDKARFTEAPAQAGTEAVPAQEVGPTDHPDADKT